MQVVLCLDVSSLLAMFGNCFDCPGRLTVELLLRLYFPSCSIFSKKTFRLAGSNWIGSWSLYCKKTFFTYLQGMGKFSIMHFVFGLLSCKYFCICWWNDNFQSIVVPKIFTSLLLIIFLFEIGLTIDKVYLN